MENVADALKIVFAVFVFIVAVALLFSLTSQARETADIIFYYGDKTNFYDYTDSKDSNRTVSVAEVISTLHRYYKESISVTMYFGEGDSRNRTFDLTKDAYSTEEEARAYVNSYIKSNLQDLSGIFEEEFVEVPISGTYLRGDDGTEITLSSGGKKVYVTYTYK